MCPTLSVALSVITHWTKKLECWSLARLSSLIRWCKAHPSGARYYSPALLAHARLGREGLKMTSTSDYFSRVSLTNEFCNIETSGQYFETFCHSNLLILDDISAVITVNYFIYRLFLFTSLGWAPALFANVKLGWKGLTGTSTLAS